MILRNLNIVGSSEEIVDICISKNKIDWIKNAGSYNFAKDDIEIDFSGCIVFPGLINSHDHLEFNLYPMLGHKVYGDYVEWGDDIHAKDKKIIDETESIPVELRMQFGILKNLICGVTSVAHHGAYNSCLDNSPVTVIRRGTAIHSVRLGGKWKLKLNHIKNLEPYVIHIGEGTNARSLEEINELIRWNFFKRKLIGIHGISMTEAQSTNFEALIWCPVSNQFLFDKTADISSLKKSTKILFGTDSTLTSGWNIWDHIRAARRLSLLNDDELFSSLTGTAAKVWKLKNTGDISEGKKCDIVIAKRKCDNLFDSFYTINPEDIFLIIKDGRLIFIDDSLKESISRVTSELIGFFEIIINKSKKHIYYNFDEIVNGINKYNPVLNFSITSNKPG